MGLFIFNLFLNHLLLLLEKKSHVFNHADDTSILCKHRDYDSAYNDLLFISGQHNDTLVQNELHAGKP